MIKHTIPKKSKKNAKMKGVLCYFGDLGVLA
jgi:hypothetical protein